MMCRSLCPADIYIREVTPHNRGMSLAIVCLAGFGFVAGLSNIGDANSSIGNIHAKQTDTKLQCQMRKIGFAPLEYI